MERAGIANIDAEEVILGIVLEIVECTYSHHVGTNTEVFCVERKLRRADVGGRLTFDSNLLDIGACTGRKDHPHVQYSRGKTIDRNSVDSIDARRHRNGTARTEDRYIGCGL